jgi:hypothetical protein
MNAKKAQQDDNQAGGWSWSVAPALPASDGRIFTKVLAYDGEYAVSYVYEHASMGAPGSVLLEVEGWLSDLWLSPLGNLYAAGESGRIHFRSAGEWRLLRTPAASMLNSVWGASDREVFAVAKDGLVSGSATNEWNYVAKAKDPRRLRGTSRNDVYAVGHRGLMLHFDGRDWRTLELPTNMHLNAAWPVSADLVYVVGPEGVLLIGAEGRWRVLEIDEVDLLDVVQYRDDVFVAAGTMGLFRLQGDELVLIRDDINATRLTVDYGAMFVAGALSFHRYDGKDWQSYRYTFTPDSEETSHET